MKKKIFFSIIIFFSAIFAAGFRANAGVTNPDTVLGHGWLWGGSNDGAGHGSGVGLVSLNCNDLSTLSVAVNAGMSCATLGNYAVNIPAGAGPVTGKAWMINLDSFLDFQPSVSCNNNSYAGACDPYPTNAGGTASDAQKNASGQIVGWARIESIAAANAAGMSGLPPNNEDGWVLFDSPVSGYGNSLDNVTGKINGYAWMGGTLGALDFSDVEIPTPPTITLSASPTQDLLIAGQTISNTNPKTNISWSVKGQSIASCAATCDAGSCAGWTDKNWGGLDPKSNGGVAAVSVPASSVSYTLTCVDDNGLSASQSIGPVEVGCKVGTCGGGGGDPQKCIAQTGPFVQTGNFDTTPDCQGGCHSDSDCKLREGTNWKEIAP